MRTKLAFAVMLLVTSPLFAAYDAFIKFDGITGESKAAGHVGWIEISGFSWGMSPAAAAGGGGTGKAAVHDISITKNVDKSSPALMQAAAVGKRFQTVTIDGPTHIVLQDVIIAGIQNNGRTADGSVRETVKLNYLYDTIKYPAPRTTNPVGSATQATVLLPAVHSADATFSGGVQGNATLLSLKLNGQTNAIIAVCNVAGGSTVTALENAHTTMPTLILKANGKQWTFTNAVVTSYTPGAVVGCANNLSLSFTRFDGPATGF